MIAIGGIGRFSIMEVDLSTHRWERGISGTQSVVLRGESLIQATIDEHVTPYLRMKYHRTPRCRCSTLQRVPPLKAGEW